MQPVDVKQMVQFNPEQVQPKMLYSSEKLRVPLLCLEPGRVIPPHASAAGVFYVIQDRGIFTLAEERLTIGPGSLVVAESEVIRGIKCEDRLAILAVEAL